MYVHFSTHRHLACRTASCQSGPLPSRLCQIHKRLQDRHFLSCTYFGPQSHILPSVGFFPEGICSNTGPLLPTYTTLYRARVKTSNFSPRIPAVLILLAGLAVLLSSVLCLAFKMAASASYIQHISWGTGMTTVKSPGYGADGWMNL